jgi:Carboxypeptidase regulatory-like domain/TonB dependent receptor
MRSSRGKKVLSIVNLLALALVMFAPMAARPVMAQATTGSIRANVTDPSGAAVVGATVRAKNQATGVESGAFKTSGEGLVDISGLIPGAYTLTVEAPGFKRSQVTDVTVNLGVPTSLDIALQAGGVEETVTVVAGTEEVVNRDQSQLSTTFETRKVEELPTNAAGAGLDTLALLVPGVVVGATGVSNNNGTELSVNGNRVRSNNFQIDGSDNNDLSVAGPSFFVDNQDQVAEYQVITNNFSAQYGRNQGAIVNIVTKGGTNEFHGSAFEYHRNRSALDSLNNLERRDPTRGKADKFISNVYGGTIGGPIVKDKAFFFGTYQGIKQRQTVNVFSTSLAILPSEFARLTANNPGNTAIAAITNLSAFALTGLGTVRPRSVGGTVQTGVCVNAAGTVVACNTAGAQGPFQVGGPYDIVRIGTQFYQAAQPERIFATPFDQQEFSGRVDMKINDRNNFYARYLFQDSVSKNALGSTNGFTGDIPARTQNFGGTYTRQIGNTMVNEFRSVYQRLLVNFGGGCSGPGCIPDPADIGTAAPDIVFTGVTGRFVQSNTLRTIGGGTGFPQGRTNQLYQFADNLSWTRGSHSMIMGAELKYTKQVVPFLPAFNGQFTFGTTAGPTRLANNAPSAFALTVGNPIITYTEWDQYYFFQDDWKVRDNLTLNLGLRYEYTGQPINDLRNLTVERESSSSPLFNPAIPIEQRVLPEIPVDKNNFAPRVGFAWTPRMGSGSAFNRFLFGENDATVIRGGFSVAYDPAFYNILLNVSNAAPVAAALSIPTASLPATNSPIPVPGTLTGEQVRTNASATGLLPVGKLNPNLLSQVPVGRDFHAPYSLQFSFGVQRQINRTNVFEARWVRTRGIGLFASVNRNPFIRNIVNGLGTQEIELDANGDGVADGVTNFTFPGFKNLLPAGITPAVCADVAGTPDNEGICSGRLIPGRGRITSRENTAQSTYDGAQFRYNGRFFNNALNIGAAYAFSKTIDDASEIFAIAEDSPFAQNPFDINRGERSRSAYDRPHAFSLNFLYDFPMFKEQRGFAGKLLGGWQLNGQQVLTSGRPYTPSQFFNRGFLGAAFSYWTDTAGGESLRPFVANPNADPRKVAISQVDAYWAFGVPVQNINGFYDMAEFFNLSGNAIPVSLKDVRYVVNAPGSAALFGTPFGNAPRNSLRGPAVNQLNLGLFKNTRITENVRIQFRAEAFNVLNHPQPGFGVVANQQFPDNYIEDAGTTFAEKGEMALARRVIQFGLRIVF